MLGAGSQLDFTLNEPAAPQPGSLYINTVTGASSITAQQVPADPSLGAVFPGAAVVYAWNPATKSYFVPAQVEPQRGYWVAMSQDNVSTVSGTPVYTWTYNITAGWNMIGSILVNASFNDPNDAPDGSVAGFAQWWDPVNRWYNIVFTLEPKKGYWVAATQDCSLTLP